MLIWYFVCITVQYLVREVTVLLEGSLFQGGGYVSKGGCVPKNLLIKTGEVGRRL